MTTSGNSRTWLGSEIAAYDAGYRDGASAERERAWSLPVTQRLELHDFGGWQCAGCGAPLAEARIAHKPRCSEMSAPLQVLAAADELSRLGQEIQGGDS